MKNSKAKKTRSPIVGIVGDDLIQSSGMWEVRARASQTVRTASEKYTCAEVQPTDRQPAVPSRLKLSGRAERTHDARDKHARHLLC